MNKSAKDHSYITTSEYVVQNEKLSEPARHDESRKSIEFTLRELEVHVSKCEGEFFQINSDLRASESIEMQITAAGVSNKEQTTSMLQNLSLERHKKIKELKKRKYDLEIFISRYRSFKEHYELENLGLFVDARLCEIHSTITELKALYRSSIEKETSKLKEECNIFDLMFRNLLPSNRDNSNISLMEDKDYMMVRKILEEPQLLGKDIKNFWGQVLPYIMQNIKMWNPYVLNTENLEKLFLHDEEELCNKSDSSEGTKACHLRSRLDFVTYIINEADFFVREEVLKMLARFNLAIPLVIPDIHERNRFIVTLPHLKSIVIKLYSFQKKEEQSRCPSQQCVNQQETVMQNFLFSSPFKMVVALRLGTNEIGKSTILNQLMKKEFMFSCNEPDDECCPPCTLNGTVEIVILIPETCSDIVWQDLNENHYQKRTNEIAILANLHGNALVHAEILKYLEGLGSSFLVFRMPDATEEQWNQLLKIIPKERVTSILVDHGRKGSSVQTKSLTTKATKKTVSGKLIESLKLANDRHSAAVSNQLKCVEYNGCKEAKSVVKFVKENGISLVKQLVMGVFAKEKECRENKIIRILLELFFAQFKLPLRELKKSMIYLERRLNKLSDKTSMQTKVSKGNDISLERQKVGNNVKELTVGHENVNEASKHVDDVKLGLEHFYRLIGEVYCRNERSYLGPVATELAPERYADLLLNGHVIELLDGDSNQIQFPWIKAIFERLSQKRPDLKVFVISVIGLQSSGKSTLLNALFACRFRVGAGRCTKGLFLRMLFLDRDLATEHKLDAIILIDTEGLCSSEKMNDPSLSHNDRKMATFAMAISNLTIVNILGEGMTEIVDILQIAIVAMTRFHEVDIKPDIIVVQHLQERSVEMSKIANTQFNEAINKSFKLITEKNTELNASCLECINELKNKLQIRGGNFHQFGSFKDGAGLNATPSEGYHNDVVKLFETLLWTTACGSTHTFEYWSKNLIEACFKAVQEENFALIFKNVKDMSDFFYFEKQISKVKEHLETTFRFHRDRFTNLMNNAIMEIISSQENSKERLDSLQMEKMEEFKAELGNIPYSCKDCEKCEEFVRKRNLFLDECQRNKIQQDAEKGVSEYISGLQNTCLEISNQVFESSAIRQGCCFEFYEIIDKEMIKKYNTTTLTLRGEEKREIVEQIWKILKSKATEKEAKCCSKDFSARFKDALHNQYVKTSVFRDICKKIETEITVESLCDTSLKQRIGRGLKEFFYQNLEKGLPLNIFQIHLVCRELDDFVRLILEKRQHDIVINGINFDESLIIAVKTEFPDILGKNESDFGKQFSPDWKQNLLLYTFQQLKKQLEPLQEKWDKMNKPSEILEGKKQQFTKLIEAKLSDEINSASKLLTDDLLEAIQENVMKKVNAAKIEALKNIPWTSDIQKVRARYFVYLAEQVKIGSKDEALDHFQNPEASIRNWLKGIVDSSPIVKSQEKEYGKELDSELGKLRAALSKCQNKTDVKKIIEEYLGGFYVFIYCNYNYKVEDADFDLFKQIVIDTLSQPTVEPEFPSIGDSYKIRALLGCTTRCLFCGALCWGSVYHMLFGQREHYCSHQLRGLRGSVLAKKKPLKSAACHELTFFGKVDDRIKRLLARIKYLSKYKELGEFENVSSNFSRLSSEPYEKLMCWFFRELHEDLSNRCNADPAKEADIKDEKFQSLDIDDILREIGNDI